MIELLVMDLLKTKTKKLNEHKKLMQTTHVQTSVKPVIQVILGVGQCMGGSGTVSVTRHMQQL